MFIEAHSCYGLSGSHHSDYMGTQEDVHNRYIFKELQFNMKPSPHFYKAGNTFEWIMKQFM